MFQFYIEDDIEKFKVDDSDVVDSCVDSNAVDCIVIDPNVIDLNESDVKEADKIPEQQVELSPVNFRQQFDNIIEQILYEICCLSKKMYTN
ncbi:hypothetical protein EAI_12718 [Harpegnathos saltator]|uniref:Uncharacterized protein n=1 Tax=Harpegnathos saltator TaxID=610380 RepID=E2C7S1_HARSA|nr:hypothetical protein EAI_12718 [Harpegnathos saltator]